MSLPEVRFVQTAFSREVPSGAGRKLNQHQVSRFSLLLTPPPVLLCDSQISSVRGYDLLRLASGSSSIFEAQQEVSLALSEEYCKAWQEGRCVH